MVVVAERRRLRPQAVVGFVLAEMQVSGDDQTHGEDREDQRQKSPGWTAFSARGWHRSTSRRRPRRQGPPATNSPDDARRGRRPRTLASTPIRLQAAHPRRSRPGLKAPARSRVDDHRAGQDDQGSETLGDDKMFTHRKRGGEDGKMERHADGRHEAEDEHAGRDRAARELGQQHAGIVGDHAAIELAVSADPFGKGIGQLDDARRRRLGGDDIEQDLEALMGKLRRDPLHELAAGS